RAWRSAGGHHAPKPAPAVAVRRRRTQRSGESASGGRTWKSSVQFGRPIRASETKLIHAVRVAQLADAPHRCGGELAGQTLPSFQCPFGHNRANLSRPVRAGSTVTGWESERDNLRLEPRGQCAGRAQIYKNSTDFPVQEFQDRNGPSAHCAAFSDRPLDLARIQSAKTPRGSSDYSIAH